VVALALALSAGACGDDDAEEAAPPAGLPTFGVEEVAAHDGEYVVLEGFLLAAPEAVHRLCSALAESYPPQCGGERVEIVGLDLRRVGGTSTNAELPEGERTLWTDQEVRLTGVVDGERFALAPQAGMGAGYVVVEALTAGQAVAGASIELWGSDGSVASAVTDDAGLAVFPVRSGGEHQLVALPVTELTTPARVAVEPGQTVVLDYGRA